VLLGKSLWVCGANGESNGEKLVVVLIVMPVSECKFTLAWYVQQQLSELRCPAVLPWQHAILG
jgi:hypothetical protein